MNNEPVAWMSSQTDEDGDTLTMLSTYHDPLNTKQIPLYAHPVDAVNISQEYVDKTQNNRHEPVAWMNEYEQICHATDKRLEEITNDIGSPRNYFKYNIPLYTHPVKELTDEEIIAVGNAVVNLIDSNEGWLEFARAILRKAQEK